MFVVLAKGFRRIEEEEEPEWFSSGPTSKSETIELRGFDDASEENKSQEQDGSKRERRRNWRKQKNTLEETVSKVAEEKEQLSDARPSSASGSRPHSGSDQSHSGHEACFSITAKDKTENEPAAVQSTDFDFNELFNLDSISGIFSVPVSYWLSNVV